MGLLGVELARFRSRQAVALLVLVTALLAAVLAGVTAYDTRPLSSDDIAQAAKQADLESQRPALRREVRACAQDPASYLGPGQTASDCTSALVPDAEAYYPRQPLDLGSVLRQRGIPLALVVVGLMVIAGSTFAGADWSSGSISTQLVFVPRRRRLWFAKAAAVALSSGVVALVVLGAFWAALVAVAESRGTTVPSADLTQVSWHVVRAVALTMGAAVGAFALTMVFRHTVATLALLFVYSVGGEIALNLLPFEGAGRWSVGNNTFGWLATHHRYFDPTISCPPGDACTPMQLMTHLESGLFLGALLVVAVAVSSVWFSRRDV